MLSGSTTPTLRGTVTDAAPSSGIAGVTVVVGGQTITATVNGTAWSAAVPVGLADGTYDVEATAADNAGNIGSTTAAGALIVDTTLPLIAVNGLVTKNNMPTLSGTVTVQSSSNPVASVTVLVGGQTLTASFGGGVWIVAVPSALADGTYTVAATATDSKGQQVSASNTLVVDTVAPVVTVSSLITSNTTPTLSGTVSDAAPSSGIAGVTVTVDGQTIMAAVSGTAWTAAVPAALPGGTYDVQAAASDNAGNVGTTALTGGLTVDTVGPTLAAIANQIVNVGQALKLMASATDPYVPPGQITYSLTAAPQGATIDPATGAFTWTAPNTVEVVGVTVSATSPAGLSATTSFTVTVAQPLVVAVALEPEPGGPQQPGDDHPFGQRQPADRVRNADGGRDGGGPDGHGNGHLARHVDAHGGGAAGRGRYGHRLLRPHGDAAGEPGGPRPQRHHAADGGHHRARRQRGSQRPVQVIGTADDPELVGYEVDVTPVNGGATQTVFTGTNDIVNGVLGTFDPTMLPNDSYVLTLTATDANGYTSTAQTTVNVVGNLKLGDFRLSFTDLSIPVAGIPITLTRIYDTLNIGAGSTDFSPGWSLDYRDTDLQTSVPWTGTPSPGTYPPFEYGTHVYVTIPGGQREGFTFEPTGPSGLFGTYDPAFVPDAGVTDALTVSDVWLVPIGNQFYTWSDQAPYNPGDDVFCGDGTYTLTTKDGTKYVIDANSGLLDTASDRNGNTLTFSDSGITSSAGPSVTFTRDSQGRIIIATDPSGKQILYSYDANGDLATVTDEDGNVTQYIYDSTRAHYLDQVIDPLGRTGVRANYDSQGRLVQMVNASGDATTIAYDPTDSLETTTDALGNTTTYVYDSQGNIVEEVDPLGGITNAHFRLQQQFAQRDRSPREHDEPHL